MPFKKACSLLILGLTLILAIPAQGQISGDESSDFAQAEKYYALGMDIADRFEKARYLNYAVGLYKQYLKSHCLLYTSPSPRDLSTSRMPSSA